MTRDGLHIDVRPRDKDDPVLDEVFADWLEGDEKAAAVVILVNSQHIEVYLERLESTADVAAGVALAGALLTQRPVAEGECLHACWDEERRSA